MKNKEVRKTVGKRTVRPSEVLYQLNEFFKQNHLIRGEKNERIRRVVGPTGQK